MEDGGHNLSNLVGEMLVHMGTNSGVRVQRELRVALWQWKESHGCNVSNMNELAKLKLKGIDGVVRGYYDVHHTDPLFESIEEHVLHLEINGAEGLQHCDTHTSADSRKILFPPLEQGICDNFIYTLKPGGTKDIIYHRDITDFEVTSFPFKRDLDGFWDKFHSGNTGYHDAEGDYVEAVKCYLLLVIPSIARKAGNMRRCEPCRLGESYYDMGEGHSCELCTKF